MLLLLLSRLVALFIPATGRRRSGERRPMFAEGMGLWRGSPWQPDVSLPPSPPLPRSPYAREAAADHRVDVTASRSPVRTTARRKNAGSRASVALHWYWRWKAWTAAPRSFTGFLWSCDRGRNGGVLPLISGDTCASWPRRRSTSVWTTRPPRRPGGPRRRGGYRRTHVGRDGSPSAPPRPIPVWCESGVPPLRGGA